MRAFLDTNIFVYATYPSFPQSESARRFLKSCLAGSDSYYLSWNVIYEYLRIVTHPQLFPDDCLPFDPALENVLRFVSSPQVGILQETPDHTDHLKKLNEEPLSLKGNLVHDAHIVALMREHDLRRIYTADSDFHRFKGIEPINPFKK